MDVAADFDRGLDFDEHGLGEEDVFDGTDDAQDDRLLKLDELSGLVVPDFEQGFDGCVNIDIDFLIHLKLSTLFNYKLYSLHVINKPVRFLIYQSHSYTIFKSVYKPSIIEYPH